MSNVISKVVSAVESEPAAVLAAVQSILAVLVGFGALNFIGLDSQTDVVIVASALSAAGALFLAYSTDKTALAPAIELFKALLAVGAIYGLHLTDEQSSLAVVAIQTVLGLFHRSQVTPLVGDSKTFDTVDVSTQDQVDPPATLVAAPES